MSNVLTRKCIEANIRLVEKQRQGCMASSWKTYYEGKLAAFQQMIELIGEERML